MEGPGSRRVTLIIIVLGIMIMIMITILGDTVESKSSASCILKCQLFCFGSKASSACTALCLKNCMNPLPEALYYCSLGCATSKCTNSTSETVEGCVDSCSNNVCGKFTVSLVTCNVL